MGRKRDKGPSDGPKQTWLVTFGDLVTLLLTFFVLLLTMASMDRSYLVQISTFEKDIGFLTYKGAGRIPDDVSLVVDLLKRPEDMFLLRDRIKDLLFPDEVLPPEMDRGTLEENLRILETPEGVALVLTDKLLFAPGQADLAPGARNMLSKLASVLHYIPAPVNISGHSDSSTGPSVDNFVLSGERAVSVLQYFIEQDLAPSRFTVSAYGPTMPMADNASEAGRAANRRVEILIKTNKPLGAYS